MWKCLAASPNFPPPQLLKGTGALWSIELSNAKREEGCDLQEVYPQIPRLISQYGTNGAQ